jgi:hypothetical protein
MESPLTKPERSLEFDPAAFEDLAGWLENDRKRMLRIVKLIQVFRIGQGHHQGGA